jgi:hypothetical protein
MGFVCGVLLLITTSVFAQSRQFSDWGVGRSTDGESIYAATINDSMGVLGQYCFTKNGNCIWLLANDVDCEEGGTYSVLMNSDLGAQNLDIACFTYQGKGKFAFKDFSTIDAAIKKSSYIGFAFPMKSGYFQVSRFSLHGALSAITYMRGTVQGNQAPLLKRNTKDTVL